MEGGREDSEAARPHAANNSTTDSAAPNLAAVTSQLADATSSPSLMLDEDSYSDAGSVDMDVSVDENAPEPEPMPPPQPHVNGAESAGAKRKLSDIITNGSSSAVHEPSKKPKLSCGAEHVGVDVWQNIFLHLSPANLARCQRVCKTFNLCLTAVESDEPKKSRKKNEKTQPTLRKIDSNKIWANARKMWMPNMPRPLAGLTELQMLQLIGGRRCQFCQREPVLSASTSVFDSGPGPDGMRVIWPFHIRTCGTCLQDKISNQTALLQTKAAALAPGLPHILLANGQHYISEVQKQAPGGIPMRHGVSVQKVFYRQHVEQIEVEDRHAEDLNSRDDWRKGLLSRGKEAMADAARWEKWESQLVRGSDFVHILREYDRSSFPEYFGGSKRKSAADQHQPPASTGHGRTATHVLPPAPIFAQPVQPPSTQPTPQDMPFHQPRMKQEPDQPWTPQPLHQPASNPPAVEQRRRARKAEIERRCLELQPPLDRSSLPGMQSFQAAMQIAQPLTDQAWEALRPRLLAEKEDMDYEAHRRAEQRAALQATMPSLADDTFLKPAKEIYDKSYDLAQEPLRKRLAEYADEHVNAVWNGYPRLDLYTSPVFAAKVILHVQQRYNADKAIDALPRPSELSKAEVSGALPLDDPFLSLDNMKWVYEKKIKPHVTDALIFICAGCVGEPSTNLGNPKWMAFEGLIQHYGAKHTDHFSKGNITVYWQTAAWPDEPPFYPLPEDFIKPRPSKNTSYKGHGNVRHTPQPRRGGMFNAPGTQNGHFSNQSGSYANGHHSGAQAHPPQSYGQSNHQHGQHLDPAASNVSEGDMANRLADDLREVWDAFDGISDKELLNCVRLQTALHHAIVRFLNKYGHPPSSDLLTQALADNPVLQPIKVANGLACRRCVGEKASGRDSYYGRIRDATLYNTKSLLLHYKMKHERDIGAAAPLSTTMLELPEMQMLLEVPLAQGMDTTKLRLIAGAFPGAFKHQPVIEDYLLRRSSSGITAPIGAGVASKIMDRLAKKNNESQQGKKKKKGKHGSSGAPGTRDGSQELAPQEPQEHEYDPRKPMTSTEEEDDEAIAAKYDTDIARKKEPARATSAAANTFSLANLDPGTLRALQAFGNHSAQSVQQQTPMHDGGMDRPPSVGRDDHVPAPEAPVPQPTAANGTVQPDIAAILASLTGGAQQQPSTPPQVATPTGTGRGSRDASVSRSGQLNPGIDQLYRSLSTSYNQDRPSTSGYAAYTSLPPQQAPMHYRPFAEPPTPSPRYEMPGSDLQAALERNARHFSQNAAAQPQSTPQQQHQQAYVPSPAYAQASPSQHVAPPRYNYIYEDQQHYGQQQGQGQPAPVQYVQRPPQQQHQQLSMGYSVPQQRTVYVDEHGREVQLIPIDAGQQQYAQVPQQVQYGGYGGYHEQQSPPGHGQGYYGGGGQYGGGR